MNPLVRPRFRPVVRPALLVVVAGLALPMLSGCERNDGASDKIQQASIKLSALTPGAGATAGEQFKLSECKAVISLLQSMEGAGEGQKAAAALLMAQAQMAIAEAPAGRAVSGERDSLVQMSRVRSLLNEWLVHSGRADASEQYDPASEVRQIDQQISVLESQIADAERRKSEVDEAVSALEQRAATQTEQARSQRMQEAGIRNQALNTSAIEGARLLQEARRYQRVADQFEVEASTLEAEAAKLSPQSTEVALEINKLREQTRLLGAAREQALARGAQARADAAEARAAAESARTDLEAAIDALLAIRNGDLVGDTDAAVEEFRKAARFAQQGASEARTSAQIAVGAAQQSLGGVHWTRAHGHSAVHGLMTSLAGAAAPLPDRDEYAAAAKAAREAVVASLENATAAYQEAFSAYERSGARGEVKDRLDRIKSLLDRAVETTSGGSVDLGFEAAPEAARPTAEVERFSDDSGDASSASTPVASLGQLSGLIRQGAFGQVAGFYHTETPVQQRAVQETLATAPKMLRLEDALKSKFGSSMAEMNRQQAAAAGISAEDMHALDLATLRDLNASALQANIAGDTATVTDGAGVSLKLRNVGGTWKLDLSGLNIPDAMLAQQEAMRPVVLQIVDEFTREVEAGQYASMQEAMMSFMQKIMQKSSELGLSPGGPGAG